MLLRSRSAAEWEPLFDGLMLSLEAAIAFLETVRAQSTIDLISFKHNISYDLVGKILKTTLAINLQALFLINGNFTTNHQVRMACADRLGFQPRRTKKYLYKRTLFVPEIPEDFPYCTISCEGLLEELIHQRESLRARKGSKDSSKREKKSIDNKLEKLGNIELTIENWTRRLWELVKQNKDDYFNLQKLKGIKVDKANWPKTLAVFQSDDSDRPLWNRSLTWPSFSSSSDPMESTLSLFCANG